MPSPSPLERLAGPGNVLARETSGCEGVCRSRAFGPGAPEGRGERSALGLGPEVWRILSNVPNYAKAKIGKEESHSAELLEYQRLSIQHSQFVAARLLE